MISKVFLIFRNTKVIFIPALLLVISACRKEYITEQIIVSPSPDSISGFSEFWLSAGANPFFLNDSLALDINGSQISGRIPYYTGLSSLKASFKTNGIVLVDDVVQTSGESVQDFRKPVVYKVVGQDGMENIYTVSLINFTGLPVIRINTVANAPVNSKENYVNARIRVDGAGKFEDIDTSVRIRGRGNSTWGLPKKPYRLRFDGDVSVLGMPKDRDWALLANYNDKTQLRNEAAFFMGYMSGLDWTPRSAFAEVFLNEMYIGTYQVCEHIKIAESRVNVSDDGFLLEVDQLSRLDPGDVYFRTPRILVNIKGPDVEEGDDKHKFISNYVNETEQALFGVNFKDPQTGYGKYIDVPSFIDWYLINEITRNNDATFFSSCFMNLSPGGKLKMGPVWDFDLAFGNINYNNSQYPEGLRIAWGVWYARLFQDPDFVAKVKERFQHFYNKRDLIYDFINQGSVRLKWSVIENNNKWKTLYTQTGVQHAIWGSYDNEVIYMKNWLDVRLEWLDTALRDL